MLRYAWDRGEWGGAADGELPVPNQVIAVIEKRPGSPTDNT